MTKHLETGIKELVEDFQLNGKPCPSRQSIEDNALAILAVPFYVIALNSNAYFLDVINGVEVKVYKPTSEPNLPITVYFHGGCFISGG